MIASATSASRPGWKRPEEDDATKITGIAFTMYPVKDMARARKFYAEVLGLVQGKNFADKWVEYYRDNGCLAITTMTPVEPNANAGGRMAVVLDPEGNAVTLHEKKQNA